MAVLDAPPQHEASAEEERVKMRVRAQTFLDVLQGAFQSTWERPEALAHAISEVSASGEAEARLRCLLPYLEALSPCLSRLYGAGGPEGMVGASRQGNGRRKRRKRGGGRGGAGDSSVQSSGDEDDTAAEQCQGLSPAVLGQDDKMDTDAGEAGVRRAEESRLVLSSGVGLSVVRAVPRSTPAAVPMSVVPSGCRFPPRNAELKSTTAVTACLGVQRILRQLNPDRPLSAVDVDIARYQAGRPDYPLGLVVDEDNNGVIVSIQPTVYTGSGRLHLPTHCNNFALNSLRVAYSFVLIHQKALHGFFGLPILKDITTQEWDARIDSPSCYGGMTGSSSGAVAALALLQATSDCVFQRGAALTGEMSLSGKMWPVDGLDEKVEAVGRAGLKKAILPPLDDEQVQDPVTDIPDGVEVVHVSTVFEAINHMVIGCGRKLVSRGGYPWLPDLVVVSSVMQTVDERHWVRHVEIAVVPGTGQVHITGDVGECVDNSIALARQTVVQNIDNISRHCLSQDVTQKIDLERLCRVGEEAGTLDLHANFAPSYLHVNDCTSTAAIALGLIALSFGLRYPSDVSVCGHLTVGGRVTRYLLLQPSYLTEAHKLGVKKVVMCSENVHRVRPGQQAVAAAADAQEEERAEVAAADTLFQAIRHVFPMQTTP